jgi:hypothetical protein
LRTLATEMPDRELTPEENLGWAILQRLEDDLRGAGCKSAEWKTDQRRAREYLALQPNPDFTLICQIAGANEQRTKDYLKTLLKKEN